MGQVDLWIDSQTAVTKVLMEVVNREGGGNEDLVNEQF